MIPPRLTTSPAQTDPVVRAAISGLLAYLATEQDLLPQHNGGTTSRWALADRAGLSADSLLSGQARWAHRQDQLWSSVERGR